MKNSHVQAVSSLLVLNLYHFFPSSHLILLFVQIGNLPVTNQEYENHVETCLNTIELDDSDLNYTDEVDVDTIAAETYTW